MSGYAVAQLLNVFIAVAVIGCWTALVVMWHNERGDDDDRTGDSRSAL